MTGRLAGKRCVITGAASGLGAATVALFVAEGATVLAVDRDPVEARPGVVALAADVTDIDAARDAVAEFGPVDALVAYAAVSFGGKLHETTRDRWAQVLDVSLMGTVTWIEAVLPGMRACGGSIVTVGSQIALAGGAGNAAYVAAKGAVMALTRNLAVDYAEEGVRVNCIAPGAIETPMLRRSFARAPDPVTKEAASRGRHAMKRFGRPEEVAKAALFLASDEASFTTGSVLAVEGGWLAL
ncbi:SDR family oxidoreductase [Thioclava sp. GXIMD2076]|uniref:SDR family oxidoreductase n=1 Tax=Thioclava kandeliae TaxID=3070818 RepID=A0ABV1SL30_9RHOB